MDFHYFSGYYHSYNTLVTVVCSSALTLTITSSVASISMGLCGVLDWDTELSLSLLILMDTIRNIAGFAALS